MRKYSIAWANVCEKGWIENQKGLRVAKSEKWAEAGSNSTYSIHSLPSAGNGSGRGLAKNDAIDRDLPGCGKFVHA